jgi:predicted unusual protein kinase regulating ubiquinone biosynthesis (AarF/ABC1/UbiB family)
MLALAWIFFTEGCRFCCTWDRDAFFKRIIDRSVRVNVVFVKVLQAYASCHEHSIDAPYDPSEVQLPTVEGLVVKSVLGTGMISIVFDATLHGKEVVLKTKRKDIDTKIRAGVRQLRPLEWCGLNSYLINDAESLLLDQLDFEKEASNQRLFQSIFSYSSEILIPNVFLVTQDYIIMEKLTHTVAPNEHHGRLICQFNMKAILFDSLYHTDLHIGNIIFMQDCIGVLDFGLVCHITPLERDLVLHILHLEFTQFTDRLLNSIGRPELRDQLLPIVNKNGLNIKIKDIQALFRFLRQHHIELPKTLQHVLIGFCINDTLLRTLCPNLTEILDETIKSFA